MNSAALSAFLEAGMKHYPEAVAAVDLFRERVKDSLLRAVQDVDRWGDFERAREREPKAGPWAYDGGHGFTVWIAGAVHGAGTIIELGLWWGRRDTVEPVILYASLNRSDDRTLLRFEYDRGDARIKTSVDDGKTRLYLPYAAGSFDTDLRLLLTELLRHIHRTATA